MGLPAKRRGGFSGHLLAHLYEKHESAPRVGAVVKIVVGAG